MVSSVAENDHFWRTVFLNDIRKDLAREVKNGSRTFYLGAAWGLDSGMFEDSGASSGCCLGLWCGQKTAGGVEAVQMLVDAVKQGFFLILALKWDSLGQDHGFRFADGHWGQGSLKSLVADSYGMDQHLHFGSRKRASSCRYQFA